MEFLGSHLISAEQLSREDIATVFRTAELLEPVAQGSKVTQVLNGAVLANLFFEPSTRTRISFGAAFSRLGGRVLDTTGFEFSSFAKGESIFDTSRVISGYADVMVVRHPRLGAVKEFSEASCVPVINGGDGPGEHPTQALLDLYTLKKELGRSADQFDGIRIALVGDLKYGRAVRSLAKLLALFNGITFNLVAPDELQMPQPLIDYLKSRGHQVNQTANLEEGLANVDAVYTTRIQEERFPNPEDAERFRGSYTINRDVFGRVCRPDTVLMHPLPRDNRTDNCELNNDLNDHPQLAIFRQTDNGIPVRMALFALVMGVVDEIPGSLRDPVWKNRRTYR
ncbi:aspartate carbamoyltransferase [Leeia oryzae]|uniref:aspartate carbamoyltransferase n=1 Tax=Leeia oryzae TaxID=356662 RepID=UPI00037E5F84|nr:aspartate carbamoyltransferase [Leeia oryzae]